MVTFLYHLIFLQGNKSTRKSGQLSRHLRNLNALNFLERGSKTMATIDSCFDNYDKEFKPSGQTLPQSVRAYRVEVLLAFAQAGIPAHKLETPALKKLLERDRTSLGQNLMDLAPMVAMIECKNLQEDLQGVTIFAATWDATYRFAEVFALIVYFFNPSTGRRQKRLINLRLLRGSLTGP